MQKDQPFAGQRLGMGFRVSKKKTHRLLFREIKASLLFIILYVACSTPFFFCSVSFLFIS